MGKYLKMADVFAGKVGEGLTVNGPSIHGENHAFYANTKDRRIAVYASHAINSHDELVAEVELLRGMVIRMQTYLDMAGEYPEKESDNPVRNWMFDALDCIK